MSSWFAFFRHRSDPSVRLDSEDIAALDSILRSVPSPRRRLLFTPAPGGTVHPFPEDEPPPDAGPSAQFPAFDSSEALSASLSSPVLREMRKDRGKFPPFTGGAVHYPLLTRTIRPLEQNS